MTHLPGVLGELAEVLGKDTALAIAREHGGTQVHVPLQPEPDHWLSQLIGQPEATAVAAALACRMGLRINVPFRPIGFSDRGEQAGGTGSTVLDEIAEIIGQQATFALTEEFMGEVVYVPQEPAIEPRIAKAIGEDCANRFCETFWRTYINFPSRVVIERRVADLAEQGLTKREIASRLNIRQARVFSILRAQREGVPS